MNEMWSWNGTRKGGFDGKVNQEVLQIKFALILQFFLWEVLI